MTKIEKTERIQDIKELVQAFCNRQKKKEHDKQLHLFDQF